jgi:uncharacterized membrane protein YccC
MPTAWAAFWTNVRRFQSDKVNPWLGFRNALGVGLPLAAGAALGSLPAGLAMSSGALNVAFRDSDAPYSQRARQLLAGSLVAGFTVFAATLCGKYTVIALALTAVWAFAAGMLVAINQSAADVGVMSLVMLLVYAAVPLPPERAALAGLAAFAGGLIQTALSLSLWPLNRYAPERRALGNLYLELSRAAASPPDSAAQSPPATAQSLAAQTALATLDQNRSVESERFRLLLIQAERMRVSLLALSRLRARMERDQPETAEGIVLDRYLEVCSDVLKSIGNSLIDGVEMKPETEALTELDALPEQLRKTDTARSPTQVVMTPALAAMTMDARFQMDALAGQIRAAIDLEASATPAGLSEFERREASKPWRLRLQGTVATLRANLSFESAALRHSVRLTVCVLLGDALARGFELRRPYWLPMTIAIVLKPDFTATFSRGVLRLAGTFAGLVFATLLVHILPSGNAVQILSVAVLMFVVRAIGGANYGILATSVTALVVFLIALSGASAKDLIAARGVNTVIGGAIALIAYGLWPTWERTQVSEAMASMLDGYRRYVQVLLKSYDAAKSGDSGNLNDLDRARVAARLARTNLEASIDRANAEPGASKEGLRSRSAMLASSHRLAHALMALEAGLSSTRPGPPREPLRKFLNDVELTLSYLASTLRGSRSPGSQSNDSAAPPPDPLPDLREDHRALVHSIDSQGQPFTLMNVETDRIANSLNSLREELLR